MATEAEHIAVEHGVRLRVTSHYDIVLSHAKNIEFTWSSSWH